MLKRAMGYLTTYKMRRCFWSMLIIKDMLTPEQHNTTCPLQFYSLLQRLQTVRVQRAIIISLLGITLQQDLLALWFVFRFSNLEKVTLWLCSPYCPYKSSCCSLFFTPSLFTPFGVLTCGGHSPGCPSYCTHYASSSWSFYAEILSRSRFL